MFSVAYLVLTRHWRLILSTTKRITKRQVESIRPASRDIVVWDGELPGFGVRVKPSGVRSYIVQYRNRHGRSRRYTIGQHGTLTAEEARRQARLLLAEAQRGTDPAADRIADLRAENLVDFAERYMAQYAPQTKKLSSIQTDRINLRCHILPALGNLPVAGIAHADVARVYYGMRATPGAANRTLALLSHMMNVAEREGLRPKHSNPCSGLDKFRLRKRERYLTTEELARLGEALAAAERTGTELPGVIAAIRLLLLTGCRLSEILTLRWNEIDFKNACLRLPDSKTGAKVVHLNAPALEVLAGIVGSDDNPYVIAGAKPGTHLVNLRRPWLRLRARAGLEDVRLHDLRHNFASVAVGLGEGLPMIGKLLGHTQAQTTLRYAHLAADPVKGATERIGATIAGMMGNRVAKVTPIRKH